MKLQAPNFKPATAARLLVLGAWLLSGCWSLVLGASLQVTITPKCSGEPLQSGRLRYKTSAGEMFSITRVSYILSGFALERPDGSWLELTNEIAWFDLEKPRSSHRIASVPSGDYRALRFHIGPDATANHSDVAKFPADHPLNPNLNNLHWSWQGGFIFMALEGMWQERRPPDRPVNNRLEDQADREAGVPLGWAYHLGNDTNRVRVNLSTPLDLTRDLRLELDFDLATLLHAPRAISFAKDGSSTHSRAGDPVAAALVANLPGAFHVRRATAVTTTGTDAPNIEPLYLPAKFTPHPFKTSATFPIPDLPRDNPLIEERVTLGRQLFHEAALSKDGTISCASCHKQETAFADPRKYSVGVRDQTGTRNGMPLFNLAWKSSFFWDGRASSLRAQALMPVQDHTEMDESLTNVCAKLRGIEKGKRGKGEKETVTLGASSPSPLFSSSPLRPDYPAHFAAAFGSTEITPEKIGLAIEAFVLTLTSFDSKFDRALKGETALTDDEKRGLELFMTEFDPRREQFGADCFHCHGGPLFQSQTFANNGLDAAFTDPGHAKITGKESDAGKFSTPSLRNIALTAPYMHDGRLGTLEEVVEHYSTGVKRSATLDPNLAKHPDGGIRLSEADRRALVAFLKTLTDEKYSK